MIIIKIEKHSNPTGIYNADQAEAWKAHAEDDLTGEWVAEAPARDTPEQAQEDARLLREQLLQDQ